ncbi:sugar phosphate nucleotidyltransferase [Brevibacillus borstelensis]|uniref:sugar phosphate nucleotidyltransferase n=1 Tax=Brevibacillus borstelensis TaxID=45462 RepID=UPI002040B6F8|nr:sugar phosphate nucleotidyltransferase [Brevibacillus borstelensis]MCM3590184.1 sugar phosphate nucleotidyltransferase [Brevibacillus borstelensis]
MAEVVGLIPCAGKGSRLSLPFSKEMFPDVHSSSYRPVVMHTIDVMKRANIEHVIFTINPQKTDLLRFLGNGSQFGMNFTYCIHPEPRSLPESINEAFHLIQDKVVAFAMPDTVITPPDFMKDLVARHLLQDSFDVSLACFQTTTPSKFGMVAYDNDLVIDIVDKPANTDLTWMWGAMVWNPVTIHQLKQYVTENKDRSEKGELILSDALANLIKQKRVGMNRFYEGTYRDLGTYDEIVEWAGVRL